VGIGGRNEDPGKGKVDSREEKREKRRERICWTNVELLPIRD